MDKIEREMRKCNMKVHEWAIRAREACSAYLTQVLDKYPVLTLDPERDEEYVTISYDGGNHPEYASNVFSVVKRVYKGDKGAIMFATEDSDDIEVYRVDTGDLIAICDIIEVKLAHV